MSPSTTPRKRNLAARMGRWSAAHWKTATFGWLAFVLVAFGLGGQKRAADLLDCFFVRHAVR